ncbi:MAG: PQQ-binding-like beta-propeller repeat protein [Micropruina sp.]
MPVTPRSPRRPLLGLATVAVVGALTLTACTAPDVFVESPRPNSPTAIPSTSVDPRTDPAKLQIPLRSLPGWTAPTALGGGEFSRPFQPDGTVTWKLFNGDNQQIANYVPAGPVAFGDPETYTKIPGVLTFRGNNYRNAPTYGTADISNKKLEIAWTHDTGDVKAEGSYWAGAGWTGQPLMVNWPQQTKAAMGLDPAQVQDKNFVEVIYPVVDGKVYRMDLATGKDTKAPIDTGFAFKGTGSVNPRGYPLLYSGMGLDENGDNKGAWRYRIFDLIQNKEVSGWNGTDPSAPRDWGAFDSSALVNAASDTLMEPAENGLIYKVKLNAKFDPVAKTVSVDPQFTKLRYDTGDPNARHGIEGSAAAYRNLMYAPDNDGNIICWDATTMQVVWVFPTGDDTDATIVLEDTPDGPFIYTGNEFDKRGEGANGAKSGPVTFRKINALTGKEVWKWEINAQYNAVNGGMMATPALGFGEVSDLVFVTMARTASDKQGDLVALDKKTGQVVWQRTMGAFSWSSPLLIQGSDGHVYGIQGDSSGLLHLFDPNTGKDFSTLQLEKNIEASPAVYNNMLVVGTYAKKLYGIRIS